MSWYRDGTVSVTNGSTNVTGAGTLWAAQVSSGDLFSLDGDKFYEVDSVTDDTHLMLKTAYAGATAAGQSYAIIRNFTSTLPAQLASKLADLMTKYHVTLDEFVGWLAGTGTVTIHDPADVAHQVKSAGQLAAESSGMLTKSVAGNADVVLTDAEASNAFLMLSGTLTGNINVIVPAATKEWIVKNATTGNYTLTVKTASGTGRAVRQNGLESIWCDGTNVLRTDSDSSKADLAGATFTGPVLVPSLPSGASGANAANADFVNAAVAGKESLIAISQSVHVGAIVASYLYDTSKDSDGGAWRKRCADKSWYNESINGAWLGQAATAAAAWALSGAVTGAYFQNTTDGKFYALAASSPAVTETFRGNAQEFPALVAIVAETARVVIYDLTQSGCPMWMVFKGTSTGGKVSSSVPAGGITTVAALNGMLCVGDYDAGDYWNGLWIQNFLTDSTTRITKANGASTFDNSKKPSLLSARNTAETFASTGAAGIGNKLVNAVVMAVLSDAPYDAATGFSIPTIAVATGGGISVIKSDGTVVNSSDTSSAYSVAIQGDYLLWASSTGGQLRYNRSISALGASFSNSGYTTAGTPALPFFSTAVVAMRDCIATKADKGVSLIKENPASTAKGMVAAITNAYNSGWMVGDIRGAWLADTVAETITGSGELVANGTFSTDTSGWTPSNAALSVVSGAMRITNAANGGSYASLPITCVVGKTYRASVAFITDNVTGSYFFRVGDSTGGTHRFETNAGSTIGVFTADFVATQTTHYVSVAASSLALAGEYFDVDNVSVKLAEPDRSVKNHGLIVNGSLTKAAAATGAQLVAYSGFSASNYLEQPYNADLDFGTGDFCVMGWVNLTSAAAGVMFDRGTAGAGRIEIRSDGTYWAYICSASGTGTSTTTQVTTGLHHVALTRFSGVIYFYVDGLLIYSTANTDNVTNTSAKTTIGVTYAYSSPCLGSLALWRVGATAPSADQIAHIYNTEKNLFDSGAKCALDGTSTAVTALAFDDVTDTLQVGTSWGRSAFRALVRVESAATQTGAITSLSAGQGAHITGGASSARYYQPAMYLRDELRRKDEARRALGKTPVFFDFDATTGQTAFTLPKGYTTKAVYSAGTLKRSGSTKDYTAGSDGFKETVTFAVAPGSAVWVSVMAVRSY